MVVAQTHLSVKLAGGYSGLLTGKTGKTHQSMEDVAVFRRHARHDGARAVDGEECRQAMRAATVYDGPVYIRITREVSPVIFGPSTILSWARLSPSAQAPT